MKLWERLFFGLCRSLAYLIFLIIIIGDRIKHPPSPAEKAHRRRLSQARKAFRKHIPTCPECGHKWPEKQLIVCLSGGNPDFYRVCLASCDKHCPWKHWIVAPDYSLKKR